MKKLFVLFLIVSQLFLLNSCNKKNDDVIRIGAILPLTGVASELGNYYKEGVILAVEEYNKNKINGKKVEVTIEDSKSQSKEAVTVMNKFISQEQKPLFVFTNLSGVTLSIAPITDKYNIPLISVASSDDIIEKNQYTIRNYISANRLSEFSDVYFNDSLKINSYGVIYINDNFGESVSKDFVKRTLNKGKKILINEPFDPNQNDFRTICTKILDVNPHGVYLIGYGKPLGIIIKQLRELKYNGIILSGAEVAYPDVINIAGDYINDLLFIDLTFNVNNKNKITEDFVNKYKEKFKRDPMIPSALAFDGITMMLEEFAKNENKDVKTIFTEVNKIIGKESLNGKYNIVNRDILYPFVLKTFKNKTSVSYY